MVAAWVVLGICCVLAWRTFRWFSGGPTAPNPWGPEIDEQMERPDAVPICTRCLEPHSSEARFCPNCGAPVDTLVNYGPYLYIFSLGHLFRIGSFGDFRCTRLTIAGFVVASLCNYSIFAPIYWFFLAKNVDRQRHPTEDAPPIVDSAG